MPIEGFVVREMTRHEFDITLSWANSIGWNPGIHDAEPFYVTDPKGFFVGIFEGKPVASISAVSYGESFGFLGFYIVQPSFRGRGLGIEIWNAGLKHLQDRNIGLDAVLEQQKLYGRMGFRPYYNSVRYQGIGIGLESRSGDIKRISEVPMNVFLSYDDQYFPAPRHVFIKSWIKQPGVISLGAMKGGELVGYGVVRPCCSGYKIGPLFADNELIADALFRSLCGYLPHGAPVFLDTPEPNSAALDLAKRHQMYPVFETVRMYTREDPGLPMDRIFGVTSFELG
jgi:GNAT superfamily N-acetyltransferase